MSNTELADPISAVEMMLNEVFQRVFQNDEARRHLGFSQISQAPPDKGLPGWYLWFKDRKGPYYVGIIGENVVLSDSALKESSQRELVNGVQFVIRYFPDIEEDIFETFSCFEQIFRMTANFDNTGATTFEGARNMHDSFYLVGYMTISFNANRDVDFFCRAPEKWRDYHTDGLALPDSEGAKTQVLLPGERDRDVEGWNLSRYVFDKIVSAYSFLIHRKPSLVGVSACPSVEYFIDEAKNITKTRNEQLKEFSLLVSFSQNVDSRDAKTMLTAESRDLIGLWDDPKSIPPAWHNDLWWSVPEHHFHDDSCYLCSCYHEHH